MFFGPRVVLFLAYLFSDWYDAFDSTAVAVLGWFFLPWTSLAYMYTYFTHGGDISGGYIILMGLALLFDVGAFGGGNHARQRRRNDD